MFLCAGFLQLRLAGATLHRGARASHCRSPSHCGAQAPDAQAQQLWLTGLVALQHVGSSRTGARPRVPCIGRRILNRCATREAPVNHFYIVSNRVCTLSYSASSVEPLCIKIKYFRASLVVRWLRIRLPMQGTRV